MLGLGLTACPLPYQRRGEVLIADKASQSPTVPCSLLLAGTGGDLEPGESAGGDQGKRDIDGERASCGLQLLEPRLLRGGRREKPPPANFSLGDCHHIAAFSCLQLKIPVLPCSRRCESLLGFPLEGGELPDRVRCLGNRAFAEPRCHFASSNPKKKRKKMWEELFWLEFPF